MSSDKPQLQADKLWLQQIRKGDDDAWQALIDQYEGRLIAYAQSRVNSRSTAEDVVQEVFVGFYRSLPNFDDTRSIEAYLYQICSFKITDHLRRSGRRKVLSLDQPVGGDSSQGMAEPTAPLRLASSIARSNEKQRVECQAIVEALQEQVEKWLNKQDFQKLKCIELLVVTGVPNKDVAAFLGLTEQQVANYKADFLTRTKTLLARQNLSKEIFPELFADS